jgi:hypothetical protein
MPILNNALGSITSVVAYLAVHNLLAIELVSFDLPRPIFPFFVALILF